MSEITVNVEQSYTYPPKFTCTVSDASGKTTVHSSYSEGGAQIEALKKHLGAEQLSNKTYKVVVSNE